MSGIFASLLARPRVTLSVALALAAMGALAFQTMPRLEDPEMPDRWAVVTAPYPGADPYTVERTILEPLEEHLAEVSELKYVDARVRNNVAILTLELSDGIDLTQIDRIWTDVEDAIEAARRDFPDGAGEPSLDRDISDPESVVLAITGGDRMQLAQAAETVERALLGLPDVARVKRVGDPETQVTVELQPATARQLGISTRQLVGVLAARNVTIPAGQIDVQGRTATLRPDREFQSVEEIADTPVPLPGGSAVRLGDVARVTLAPTEPAPERMRLNGVAAVGIGVVPARPVDLVRFGDVLRAELAEVAPRIAPLTIDEVTFQPARVQKRLTDLGGSLLLGVLIVALVLLLTMGLRMGLLVAAIVPVVALASLGLYALGGGVLHQMSIAALVIALGMLVDNAIVITENVQARIDEGTPARAAAGLAARELAIPLGAATGTTVAAFIPMLMARGPVADFTRALPIVILLTLLVSYAFALLVTPALAVWLRPSKGTKDDGLFQRLSARLGRAAVARPWAVMLGVSALMAASLSSAGKIGMQFFPGGDRNQLLVDLQLPEGADVERTDAAAARLERVLLERGEVVHVASFVGRAAPHFYYNVNASPSSPHRAQLLVTTTSVETVLDSQAFVRDWVQRELPEVTVAARKLEQGPGVAAPVEVRIYGDDLADLATATRQVLRAVKNVQGTRDVRDTLGTGVPSLQLDVDDATAARHGLSRSDVVLALLGQTRGLEVGQLRSGHDPVPILVRSPHGRFTSAAELDAVDVVSDVGPMPIPLGQLAEARTEWQPAMIRHRHRRRVTAVLAELSEGVTINDAWSQLQPALDELQLPAGVDYEMGGAGEGSSNANTALIMSLPLGLVLLLGILLVEFNSFRRVLVILSTVPLAAVGVIPGLVLGAQPFGFMSMLGVFALAGVVVNNAIVLLDVADRKQAEGVPIAEATELAVRARTRPILLTTATTVAGLIPLAISDSTLWPPLAWAMISGLTASTLLTLLVVPALHVLLQRARVPGRAASATALVLVTAAVATSGAHAQSAQAFDLQAAVSGDGTVLDVERATQLALAHAPQLKAAQLSSVQASEQADAQWVQLLPRLWGSARYTRLNAADADSFIDTSGIATARAVLPQVQDPVARGVFTGLFDQLDGAATTSFSPPENQYVLGANLTVPVSAIFLQAWPAHRASLKAAEAKELELRAERAQVRLNVQQAYYGYARALGARAVARRALSQAQAHRDRVQRFVDAGKAAPVDLLSATARVEEARGGVARVDAMVRTGLDALQTLTGEPLPAGVGVSYRVWQLPADAGGERALLVERALKQRPELQALERALEAQGYAVRAARGGAFPSLALQGNVQYANPNLRFLPPEDRFQTSWDVSAVLQWSPNDALRSQRLSKASATEQAQISANLEAMGQGVHMEVVRAWEQLHAARAAAATADSQLAAAEEAFRVRVAQYDVGAGVAVDVLDADLQVTRARLSRLNAVLDAHVARAQLSRAVGSAPQEPT